ncbi:hypothetical protein D3C77_418570 [compost metagenome]
MPGLNGRLPVHNARCMPAEQMAVNRGAPWLIERHPMLDQAVELTEHRFGEHDEGVDRLPVLPAAVVLKRLRQLPVVQCAERLDSVLEQLVHQQFVMLDSFPVHFAEALRVNARPRYREAVGFNAQLLHKLNVFLVTVVAVTGNACVIALKNFSGRCRHDVPDAQASPVLIQGAFDLISRGRYAPDKVFRKLYDGHVKIPLTMIRSCMVTS